MPPRHKIGSIRNCFIAGNSAAAPASNAAIQLTHCRGVLIENNRFGCERQHDGLDEAAQGAAVNASGAATRQGNGARPRFTPDGPATL